jgi:hypothetical protein
MPGAVPGAEPPVDAAYRQRRPTPAVSGQAVPDKLDGLGPGLSAALAGDAAGRGPHRGGAARVPDGDPLAATEHRLADLRTTRAAPLPGKVRAVLGPEAGLAAGALLTPDGRARERSPVDEVLARVGERDPRIADRNFGTFRFLSGIARNPGAFAIRRHGTAKGDRRGVPRRPGGGAPGRPASGRSRSPPKAGLTSRAASPPNGGGRHATAA